MNMNRLLVLGPNGKVTPGTEVIFRAFDDSTGNQFGRRIEIVVP